MERAWKWCRSHASLQQKTLAITLPLIILPMLMLVSVGFMALKHMEGKAEARYLKQRENDLRTIAESPALQAYVQRSTDPLDQEAEVYRQALEKSLKRFVDRNNSLELVYPQVRYIDHHGIEIAKIVRGQISPERHSLVGTDDFETEFAPLYPKSQAYLNLGPREVYLSSGSPMTYAIGVFQQASDGPDLIFRGAVALEFAQLMDFRHTTRMLGRTLIAVTVFSLGVALVLMIHRVRRLTDPIYRLAAAATSIAHGQRSVRVGIDSHDEIGQLAQSFNEMSINLETHEAALQQAHDTLEHEVQVRTAALEQSNTRLTQEMAERQRLEGQMVQAQKMQAMGTLAGGIAHEFNNTLAAILGFTQLATYDVPPASPTYQHLQAVLSAGNRAKELVQQILTFSHQSSPERQAVDLGQLVQDNLSLIRASLPTTITIEPHIAPEAGTVLADSTQLHQIVMNLCANAEHAMREMGGQLEVEVAPVEVDADVVANDGLLPPGSYVRLTIRDTGCGMSPEVMARVFEPFFTTKGIGEGTGMGLAIVHGIVTSYGGSMTVASRPGEGSEFAIYLPRIEAAAVVEPPDVTEPLPQGHGCILYVDDEELLVRLGREMLESLGYEVFAMSSSVEALETFKATPGRFDLVITDQTMPTLTGANLARELRRIRFDIPIILCTGYSHVMDAERAKSMGINAFCMKPLDIGELARTIERVLEYYGDADRTVAPSNL